MTAGPQITIVIPYHRARAENGMLAKALWSLEQQNPIPSGGIIALPIEDTTGAGAAATRQAGLDQAETPWVGFLDSDDWLYPDHVARLWWAATTQGLDYVFSYFTVHDMWEGARPDLDPLQTFGREFDNAHPHQTTGTILIRQDALYSRGISYREQPDGRMIPGSGLRYGEDFDLVVQCARAGLRIGHVPRRTWAWRIGHHNTSGQAGRGDAVLTRKE